MHLVCLRQRRRPQGYYFHLCAQGFHSAIHPYLVWLVEFATSDWHASMNYWSSLSARLTSRRLLTPWNSTLVTFIFWLVETLVSFCDLKLTKTGKRGSKMRIWVTSVCYFYGLSWSSLSEVACECLSLFLRISHGAQLGSVFDLNVSKVAAIITLRSLVWTVIWVW